ncbi:MAG: DUF373 family protein [Candidatus Thermoplasmatota archaeon]|jgi:putative membrane protein|nr:DUF373 family protein [Candidatus Thermoplasmatota archaeon]
MKTLILCVDRDDDLGEKAKVASPVMGRKDNLRAALALGVEDPEDSDTNVIFMGLKLYKRYKAMGREVELASICGNKNVGIESDANLVKQFYMVLEKFTPDTLVLVSDGAEDEVILPLISQRVQVEHIARVVIKQAQNLESTYYIIMSAFKSPKIGKKIIVPISLILMIWGILMIMGLVEEAIGMMVTFFALFLIIKALSVEDQLTSFFKDTSEALKKGRYLLFIGVFVSLAIIIGGLVFSFIRAKEEVVLGEFIFRFFENVWVFLLSGVFIYTLTNSLETYIRTGSFTNSSGTVLLTIIGSGLVIHSLFSMVGTFTDIRSYINWKWTIGYLSTGIIILLVSGMIYIYNRSKLTGKGSGLVR